MRLAFHDCLPYKDGSKGCDGCLNMEVDGDLEDNQGLQFPIAVLEAVYTNKNYPQGPKPLDQSPKDLGMSRADLWAFSGLVALAFYQKNTKELCEDEGDKLMCDDPDPCFSEFPEKILTIFKTGRKDCQPKDSQNSKFLYLTQKREAHPAMGFNGKMTVDYFKKNFDFSPREALALMGAHTVGRFNGQFSRLDYAWVRNTEKQSFVFNNKYYKIMATRPAKVKTTCVGNPWTPDQRAPAHWDLVYNVIQYLFTPDHKEKSWINPSKEKPGHLNWMPRYNRLPECNNAQDAELWAKYTPFNQSYCCAMDQMDETCLQYEQDKTKHLSTDIGFYLSWDVTEDGLPTGCGAFEGMTHKSNFYKNNTRVTANCPLQTIRDQKNGKGMKLHKRVEFYADNQEEWLKDFFDVFDKLQQKVENPKDLVQGPNGYWNITEDMSCKNFHPKS